MYNYIKVMDIRASSQVSAETLPEKVTKVVLFMLSYLFFV